MHGCAPPLQGTPTCTPKVAHTYLRQAARGPECPALTPMTMCDVQQRRCLPNRAQLLALQGCMRYAARLMCMHSA
jgi:hypothetical protein